jgi:acetyltransferase-like isoleucine patch superfamily enzyme
MKFSRNMDFINQNIKKLIHYLGKFLRLINIIYLRLTGVKIGKGCMISLRAKIDVRRGEIIIGNKCTITYGCVILSHDASASHINREDAGEGKVIIGDNVYIGVHSVILRNVKIGDNSVIGAGSVVTKDIPSNVVALGNPARVVKRLEGPFSLPKR